VETTLADKLHKDFTEVKKKVSQSARRLRAEDFYRTDLVAIKGKKDSNLQLMSQTVCRREVTPPHFHWKGCNSSIACEKAQISF
jgi:hypothetical protein